MDAALPSVFNSHIHMWDKSRRHRGCQGRALPGFTEALPCWGGGTTHRHMGSPVTVENTRVQQKGKPGEPRALGACCHHPNTGSGCTSSRLVPLLQPAQRSQ